MAEQIAAYCGSGLAGGVMFYVWRRMQEEDRRRVWLLYGWFSRLMLCGSCFGAVSWAARSKRRRRFFHRLNSCSIFINGAVVAR